MTQTNIALCMKIYIKSKYIIDYSTLLDDQLKTSRKFTPYITHAIAIGKSATETMYSDHVSTCNCLESSEVLQCSLVDK
jgi:hypothetical protein